ncbi:ArsR/SmtB family transcription factor [Acidiphilium sp.]|uniref:ArsR/SmtB family transcription factor n=1 Tax=Acidiphilium sp. TaxID=527 RepID=UPI003D0333E6
MEMTMHRSSKKDSAWMVTALSALAHEHRLAAYRLLVEAGPAGISAGEIAEKLGLVPSSFTFHVQALRNAGLISQRRASRHVIYAADFTAINTLVGFLVKNCCGQDISTYGPACDPARPSVKQKEMRAKAESA